MAHPVPSPDFDTLRAQLGGYRRRGNAEEAARVRQALADAGAERRIRRLLDSDPAPSDAARARCAALLLAPFAPGGES